MKRFGNLHGAFFLFVCTLGALHLYGAFFPGSANWGFHFLGYLPRAATALYAALFLAALLVLWRGWLESPAERAGEWCDRNPGILLLAAAAGMLLLAFIFRVKAPLLGDSFTFIRNLTDAFDGTYPLGVWHEPLAMYFFYYALQALHSTATAELIRAFVGLDALFALVFLVALYRSVRLLFDEAPDRLLMFLWVLFMPTTLFFFGYVEIYAFTLMFLALYLWLSLLVMVKKVPFAILPPALLVMVFIHYLNGLLGISLLYLAYLELRDRRYGQVAAGVGVAAAGLVAILASVQFELGNLMDQSPISHFLSLTDDVSKFNAYSQAFTLFSAGHAVELANFALLMFPLALFLIVYLVSSGARILASSRRVLFLSLITFPYMALIAATKIQQGMGNDWDVTAGYFVLFTLTAGALLAAGAERQARRTILLAGACVTLLNSLVWFSLNATVDANVRRVEGLFDRRMISQLGHYTISLHLSRYFDYRGDSLEQVALWKRYSELFPGDPRGYENTLEFLGKLSGPADRERIAVLERWIAADPANEKLRALCAALSTKVGSALFARDSVGEAIGYFQRACLLDPHSPSASNNLGGALARSGRPDLGAKYFLEAIAMDSTYSDAYFNLAMAYEDMKEREKSLSALRKAASLGNSAAVEYMKKPPRPPGEE